MAPKKRQGFGASPGSQEFNQKIAVEAVERKEEKIEEERRQDLIIEEEFETFARQLQEYEEEQQRIAQEQDKQLATQERKRKRLILLQNNKKTYCCCGHDKKGGKCAEAQLILSSYISSKSYASGFFVLPSLDSFLRNKYIELISDNDENNIDFSTPTRRYVSYIHWHPDFISKILQSKDKPNQSQRSHLTEYIHLEEAKSYGYSLNKNDFFDDETQCFYSTPNFSTLNLKKYIIRTQALNSFPAFLNLEDLFHFKMPTRQDIYDALTIDEKEVIQEFQEQPEIMAIKHCLLLLNKINIDELTETEKSEYRGYVIGTNQSGLTRRNMLNDNWHDANPHAAKFFFGFVDWKETKLIINALFPNVSLDNVNLYSEKTEVSDFEKILIVLIKYFRAAKDELLSLIWNRDTSTIYRYLQQWSPQVGEAGEDLSILDINEEYLIAEKPQGYIDQDLNKVVCQVDGKVFMMDVYRTHNFKLRAMFADKVDHAGSLVLTWTCPSGLSIEHTYPMTGRSTESRNVELWGSFRGNCLDREFPSSLINTNNELPIVDSTISTPERIEVDANFFLNIDNNDTMSESSDNYFDNIEQEQQNTTLFGGNFTDSSVISNIGDSMVIDNNKTVDSNDENSVDMFFSLSDNNSSQSGSIFDNITESDREDNVNFNVVNVESILQGSVPSNIRGIVDDLISSHLTTNPDIIPEDIDEIRLMELDGSADQEDLVNNDPQELARQSIDICAMMDSLAVDWEQEQEAESLNRKKATLPKFSVKGIEIYNKLLLQSGPDGCKQRKLRQLERHQRLNELYKTKQLKKNLLSYNLFKMSDYREILIGILKGGPIPEGFKVIPSRLQKLPIDWAILADRGFAFDTFHYPNLNHHLTPHFMSGRPQFEINEIESDRKICSLRYTCETCFARVTNLWGLRDVIPYSFFPYLTDMVHWGHANVNFGQPLQKPTDYDSLFE